MKRPLILLLALFLPALLFAEESLTLQSGPATSKAKVLILPLANKTDAKQYRNSELVGSIVFRSFYTFIGIIPTLDVPDESVLTNLLSQSSDIPVLASNQNADIIIYGDYQLTGNRAEPSLVLNLKIFTRATNGVVFTKAYKTTTGAEIFDTIDEMIANCVKVGFNIEVNVATVLFSGFEVGDEKYGLQVNGKRIVDVTNTSFNYSLKVLPDQDYQVELIRDWDKKVAFTALVNLKPYANLRISYPAKGSVRIQPLANPDRLKTYRTLLDQTEIVPGALLTNVSAGRSHKIEVFDQKTNLIYQEEFYLHDGENREFSPSEKSTGLFHFKAFSLDHNMLSLGADLFLWRYFWIGAGVGGSVYLPDSSTNLVFFVSPSVELGYYFWGDHAYDLRIGAGLIGKLNLYLNDAAVQSIAGDVQNYSPNLGVFIQAEWWIFMFRPTFYVYLDENQTPQFDYGLGVGFKL